MKEHVDGNPFTEDELDRLAEQAGAAARDRAARPEQHYVAYGSTLLVAILTDEFLICFQLGDGDILAAYDATDEVGRVIPKDESLIANETTSLCQDDALRYVPVRVQANSTFPAGPRAPLDGRLLQLVCFPRRLPQGGPDYLDMLRTEGAEEVEKNLPAWLEETSRNGSGDDITVGIIYRRQPPLGKPKQQGKPNRPCRLARRGEQGGERCSQRRQGTPASEALSGTRRMETKDCCSGSSTAQVLFSELVERQEELSRERTSETGQVVQTEISGQPCQVEKFLGGGGQGEVYQARWAGGSFALKWYFPQTATADQRETLQNLFKEPPPSDAFLWPLDMATAPGVPGFGYLMRLREPRFKGLLDLMNNRIDPKFRVLATVGLALADNFFKLHAKGLCYRDISFGNAFFDPDSGEVAICDNDNVTTNRSPKVSVLGTPEFMAPEIVRREALPSRQTDLYSLSVLLFFIFHIHHPLKGKKVLSIHCWDLPSQEKMFGTEPVFIFDPDDKSNEAVDKSFDRDGIREAGHNALVYWPIFPQFLRDTFTRAFTAGLKDPENGRVTGGRVAECALPTPRLDLLLRIVRQREFLRPRCGEGRRRQAWLRAGRARRNCVCPSASAWAGRSSCCPTTESSTRTTSTPRRISILRTVCAEVSTHPADPNIWGLKNCTGEKWVATMPDGSVKDIEPGRSVRLADKTKVQFRQGGRRDPLLRVPKVAQSAWNAHARERSAWFAGRASMTGKTPMQDIVRSKLTNWSAASV